MSKKKKTLNITYQILSVLAIIALTLINQNNYKKASNLESSITKCSERESALMRMNDALADELESYKFNMDSLNQLFRDTRDKLNSQSRSKLSAALKYENASLKSSKEKEELNARNLSLQDTIFLLANRLKEADSLNEESTVAYENKIRQLWKYAFEMDSTMHAIFPIHYDYSDDYVTVGFTATKEDKTMNYLHFRDKREFTYSRSPWRPFKRREFTVVTRSFSPYNESLLQDFTFKNKKNGKK